jgi:hypothetical protein
MHQTPDMLLGLLLRLLPVTPATGQAVMQCRTLVVATPAPCFVHVPSVSQCTPPVCALRCT